MILMIAMPTLGEISTPTVKSLIGLTQAMRDWKIPFSFQTYEFSDIVFSRNQLLSMFWTNARFTHVLFLDSDMAFRPDTIRRLMAFDADFVAAAYPQKMPRWQRLRDLIEDEFQKPEAERASMQDILHRTWVYNHQRADFGGAPWTAKRRDGFITVPATGTGMMLLNRDVPRRMIEAGVALPKPVMSHVPLHKGLKFHDFFSHLTSPDGGLMYGEDQSFCMRWTHHCQGDLWLDTQAEIDHYGVKAFNGNYAAQVGEDFPEIQNLLADEEKPD